MLILVGASATGKTEIAKKLVSDYGFTKMVTYTTRSPRVGEVDGVDYHFITQEKFRYLQDNNRFIETVQYNGNYYGTLKDDVQIKKVVILEPLGLEKFYDNFDKGLVSMYISVDKDIRKKRMINRGDKLEDVEKRLNGDDTRFDLRNIKKVDYVIENNGNDLDKVVREISQIYQNKVNC